MGSHCFGNTVEPLLSGLRLTVNLTDRASQTGSAREKGLTCRHVKLCQNMLQFLEQERDSNFSDILALRKLCISIKLKRSKKTKQCFLTDIFKKDS